MLWDLWIGVSSYFESLKKNEPAPVGGGNATCHCSPTICGAGDVTLTQLLETKSLDDCKANPADAKGHEISRFVSVMLILIEGLLVLRSWSGPSAAVAEISEGLSAAL